MLSQKTRYALKALLELALVEDGLTLSSSAISARQNIPAKFLEAILVELKHDGLIRGQRGRHGGYRLARDPQDISFGAVVRLTEGPLALLPCVSVSQFHRCADCVDLPTCELRKVFGEVRNGTARILDGWTLADALGRRGRPSGTPAAASAKRPRRRLPTQHSRSQR